MTIINTALLVLAVGHVASIAGYAAEAPTAAAAAHPVVGAVAGQDAGLAPGANSFTEAQARSRLAQEGFRGVAGLHRDRQGIWRGIAVKDGQTVAVALDYRGNVEPP